MLDSLFYPDTGEGDGYNALGLLHGPDAGFFQDLLDLAMGPHLCFMPKVVHELLDSFFSGQAGNLFQASDELLFFFYKGFFALEDFPQALFLALLLFLQPFKVFLEGSQLLLDLLLAAIEGLFQQEYLFFLLFYFFAATFGLGKDFSGAGFGGGNVLGEFFAYAAFGFLFGLLEPFLGLMQVVLGFAFQALGALLGFFFQGEEPLLVFGFGLGKFSAMPTKGYIQSEVP